MATYADYSDLISRFPAVEQQPIAQIEAELIAATEWIDGHCHRTFSLEDSTTVRYFCAEHRSLLDLGHFEIGTTDSVVVETDDGTGTFATTVSSTSYQLEPLNAPYAIPAPRPYTEIRAIGTFWPYASFEATRQERVRVTARYGWPAVPDTVARACLLLAGNVFENPTGARSESIDGYSVTYMSAAGEQRGVPSSVIALLRPFVRGWAV